jgi:hypothetical protein
VQQYEPLMSPANHALGAFGPRWRLFDFGRVDAEVKAAWGRIQKAGIQRDSGMGTSRRCPKKLCI